MIIRENSTKCNLFLLVNYVIVKMTQNLSIFA